MRASALRIARRGASQTKVWPLRRAEVVERDSKVYVRS